MVLFCSAGEFENLCCDIADKADLLRLQAKGGSMYPFIRSGDWVSVALCKDRADSIRKGDILLFKKDDRLYLHRVLRTGGEGFFVKGDMSFGSDGVIKKDDVLARVISIQRGARRIDLGTQVNRLFSVLAADSSLFLQYPFLFARKMIDLGMVILSRIQSLKVYRLIVKKIMKGNVTIRVAGLEDVEQIRDLYLMAGHDIRDGLAQIKNEGFWLIAERKRKVVAGLTMTRYEQDPALWVIFGLEVKPFFRGMGVGRAIAEEALLKAKESGARQIGLFVKKKAKPALGLYRSLGFEVSDAVPAEFNRSSDEFYLSYEVEKSSDWRAVLEKAVGEGLFYPLYRNLLSSEVKDAIIPQAIRERFKQTYYLYLSKSSDFDFRVERILGFLESRKIKVLLFKGPAIDNFIYDGFLRPRLDLDIVVSEEEMPALENALHDLGYTIPEKEKDYPVPEYLNSRLFISQADDLIPVHVHKHLINNMFLTVDNVLSMDMEEVWQEVEPFKNYRYICMLKPELNIIYLCEHGLKHDFDQIIFLYEIERLISFYEVIFDWKKFVKLAKGLGLVRPAYYGLYFIQELLSARIPQEVMDVLKPVRFTLGEKSFIKNTLYLKRRRYGSYSVYCAMRTGIPNKIYFVFRTLFPPEFTFKGYVIRMRRLILP
jgi:ribosomal protein S18 acetylase RimI-like enzyme